MESLVWSMTTGVFGYAMFCLGMQSVHFGNNLEAIAYGIVFFLIAGGVWGLTGMLLVDAFKTRKA